MTSDNYRKIAEFLEKYFPHIIVQVSMIYSFSGRIQKIRIELITNAFVDIYYSKESSKYSFHYEREKDTYRHDNSPHYPEIKTFPKHCHFNNQVIPSYLSDNIFDAAKEFFNLVIENFITKEQ